MTSRLLSCAVAGALTAASLVAFAEPAAAGNFGYTLEACQQDGTITLPDGGGNFICPDAKADYTTGNLGKNWNELDLVPHRLTLSDSEAEAVTISYGGDHKKVNAAGTPVGWDVVGDLKLNQTLTTASGCDNTPTIGGQHEAIGATGGAYSTVEKTATIDMPDTGTRGACVYDFYLRLALGAHSYPGSSLQSYVSSGGGKKTLSLPVQEALPQTISKDMTAVRDARQLWDVTKSPTDASVTFGNTCLTGATTSAPVDITVTWRKIGITPSGDARILAHVYASNPAARAVTVTITDRTYTGTTQADLVHTWTSAPTVLAAGAGNVLVGTNEFTVAGSATAFNDVATGTYTDTVTGVTIPQTTTASATATVTRGSVADGSVTVSDVESLTGAGFSFSVDSTSGAAGTFAGGYTLGTKTTGPVTWTSGTQTADGSVTFHKTVYGAMGTIGSGNLTDTATVSNGSSVLATSNTVNVPLSADTKVSLTIDKTIAPAADQPLTFLFDVARNGTTVASSVPITLTAGDLEQEATLSGLAPGSYTVHEQASGPFPPQDAGPVDLSGTSEATCSASLGIQNAFDPPVARVRKATDPTGDEAGWTFTLTGGSLPAEGLSVTTTGAGYVEFPGTLDSGTYTIAETGQAGWDLTGVSGEATPADTGTGTAVGGASTCTLTVDQVADAGRTFSCTFTNTERGHIWIVKQTVPERDDQLFGFSLTGDGVSQSFQLADGQTHDSGPLVPGTYDAGETLPEGWDNTSATCSDSSSPDAIDLDPGETVTCTYVNTKRGRIIVDKVTDPAGDEQLFDFSLTGGPGNVNQSFQLAGPTTPHNSGLILGGTYAVAETVPAGWDADTASCSDGSPVTAVELSAGETVTCTFSNSKRGHVVIDKVTVPSGDPQSFAFTLTGPNGLDQGFSLTDAATPHDSGAVKAGTYSAAETVPAGWDRTGATCSDGSAVTAIALAAGETVTCTFTNTKRGTVTVQKKENGAAPTTAYTFRLTGGPDSVSVSRTTSTANGGSLAFGTQKPGSYTLCELAVPAGTHSTLQDAPYNGTLNSTTGDVCVSFTLTAGQDRTFTVDNTYPKGNARTIGYWKNWNTCAKASPAKALKTGNHLMDEFLPIWLAKDPDTTTTAGYDGFVVPNCTVGVAVLGAASGKYAENQLAAQLLAARLNVKAGAAHSATTDAKIAAAMALLQQISYGGPPSAKIGSTSTLRAQALALATYLDKYNNNLVT
jgi:hypothetical protein